jgi:hypothetical protein
MVGAASFMPTLASTLFNPPEFRLREEITGDKQRPGAIYGRPWRGPAWDGCCRSRVQHNCAVPLKQRIGQASQTGRRIAIILIGLIGLANGTTRFNEALHARLPHQECHLIL